MISIDHLFGFVTGVATGVVGKYAADILTDRRRKNEATRVSEDDFTKLRQLMPELFDEMRKDLAKNPLCREFILLGKTWGVGLPDPNKQTLCYYFEEHDSLKEKCGILESKGYVEDLTISNTDRYLMTEQLVEMLQRHPS